ncbi:MAG: hypothetical protein K2H34_04560 [Lachnospiraceae bacterium]|nr:hypothetical protein [Lachnospiraceae bacterium]
MNAKTYHQVVSPVLAVLATPKYNHRKREQQPEKRAKKPITFESLFQTACSNVDDPFALYDPGCYGKDAKPVVGYVSSFNRAM